MARQTGIEFTSQVTRRHGEVFAKLVLADVRRTEIPSAALGLTGVMSWPDEPDDDAPEKLRFSRIADEILIRTFDEMEKPLREAFVRIAGEVIGRERDRSK